MRVLIFPVSAGHSIIIRIGSKKNNLQGNIVIRDNGVSLKVKTEADAIASPVIALIQPGFRRQTFQQNDKTFSGPFYSVKGHTEKQRILAEILPRLKIGKITAMQHRYGKITFSAGGIG